MDDMEPISAAKAVSATASAANAVAKNSIVQALFLPTAKAYGDHWGREAKEKLAAAADAKREENVTAHLEAVRRTIGADFQPDPALADAWIDGVKDVDPVDADLAAAWRGVLLAIGAGDLHRQKLLSVVKALSPEEAHSFMLLAATDNRGDVEHVSEHRRRLEELGLLRRPLDLAFDQQTRQTLMTFAMSVVMVVTVAVVIPAMVAIAPRAFPIAPDFANLIQAAGTTLGVMVAVMGLLRLFFSLSRPRLSALGYALVAVANRVRTEPAADPGNASPPAEKPKAKRKKKAD